MLSLYLMSRAGTAFVLLIALVVAVATVPIPARADTDPESASLTEYLHNHKLPAVGAQITTDEDGTRTVMLYGFVATQLGFDNAEKRTRSFLHDPNIRVVNRIKIEPELLALGKHGSQAESGAANGPSPDNGPPAIVDNAPPPSDVGDITQYQTQSPAYDPYAMAGQGGSTISGSSLLIPLLGGLLIYGAMGGLGSPGYSSPPSYPYQPYRPYYPPPRPHHRHR